MAGRRGPRPNLPAEVFDESVRRFGQHDPVLVELDPADETGTDVSDVWEMGRPSAAFPHRSPEVRRVSPAARGARPFTSRARTRVMPAIANDAFIDVRFGKRTGRVREDSRRGGTFSELWLTQGQSQTSYWVRSFDDT